MVLTILIAGGVALVVGGVLLVLWVVDTFEPEGMDCDWATDSNRDRIASALSAIDVPNEQQDLGVRCDYGTLVGVRTFSDSAESADGVERSLLDLGWFAQRSRNRAFCLPGSPYMYAVISRAGQSTWYGDGIGQIELMMSRNLLGAPPCPE